MAGTKSSKTGNPSRSARSKKEFDKEQMYRKLMPSGLAEIRREAERTVPDNSRGEESPPVPILSAPRQVPSYGKAKPAEAHHVAVPSLDSQQNFVVNVMEAKVLAKLNELMEHFSCCRCDRCKKDIVALALNKLPPKYMVLAEGQPVPDIDQQTNAQVVSAMIQAAVQVRAHPRH